MATIELYVTGAGDETNIPVLTGAATHWEAVETDDTASLVATNTDYVGSWYYDLFQLQDPGISSGDITNARIYVYVNRIGLAYAYNRRALKTNGTVTFKDTTGNGTPFNYQYSDWAINPITGVAWTWTDITNLQIGVSLLWETGIGASQCAYIYAAITYTPTVVAPTVTTQAVTNVGRTTATGNGNITDDGGGTISQHGHCWNTTGNPTTADDKTTNGAGSEGAFTSNMTNLTENQLYYVKAYATNEIDTSYGDQVSFYTLSAFRPQVIFI